MAENKQVIIDLKVNSNEALQATVALTDKLNDLKTTKKELEKQLKEDKGNQALKEQLATVNAQINSTASSLKGYQKELNNAVKAQESENKSLEQQRATLNTLIAKWDRLSEAERDGAKGTELINQIQSTTENISKLEESTGRFQRNVGNYKSALEGAGAALQGLGFGASGAIGGIQKLGVAFKALIANPIGAVIAAIVVVFQALKKAFKENDDAGTNLARAFSMFQPIIDAVKNAFSFLADVLGKVALGISKVYKAIYGFLIPGYKDAAKAADELVVAQDKLEDKQRETAIENAKNNKKIAENNAKIADKEKTTAKERIKLLNENAKLEKQNLDRSLADKREEYRILKKQADRKRKLSEEEKQNLNNLQVELINLEANYQNSLVSINKRTSAAIKEINKESEDLKKKEEERRQKAAERYKQIQQDRLEVEQELFNITATEFEKQRAETDRYYNELVKKAHGSSKQIEQIEKQRTIAIAKLYQARLSEQVAAQNKTLADSLSKAKQTVDQFFKDSKTWDQVASLAESNEERQRMREAGSNTERLQIAQEYALRRLQIAQMMYDNMSKLDTESDAEFALRQQKQLEQIEQFKEQYNNVSQQIAANNTDLVQQQIDLTSAFTSATKQMSDAIIDALSQSAGDEEKYQKWKLIMSIIEAQIQGALAIMSAIATATPGDPYSVAARIASAAAAAGAASTVAIAQLISLKGGIPNAPRFAEGGLVTGPGTGTSDSITARLSNGESVMTARTTQMFAPMLSAMNVAGGGAPITQASQDNTMRDMITDILTSMPNPVVSVKEIANVSNKVKVKESISKNK